MAAAAPSPLASSTETTNGAKLSRLLIDGGTTVLRSVFDSFHPPANLAADLNASYSVLNNLLCRRILNGHQWHKLFPPGGAAPDSNTFDITLLFLLLTEICGLSPPPTGWYSKPPSSDTSREANLARVKFFRNQLYGHVSATGVDTATFNALWLEISGVLVALGLGQAEIDKLKAERCGEEDYLDTLRDWAESEKDIKSQLKEIKSWLEVINQVQIGTDQDSKRTLDKLGETQVETSQTVAKVLKTQEEHLEALQELQRTFEDSKGGESNQEDEILKKLAKVDTQNDVKYYAERYLEGTRESIFTKVKSWLDDRNSPNRVMVISANPGMGKSVIAAVICKRMKEAGRLSGSHFCHHDKARHRNPKVMLQSLACHLSSCLPEYKKALVEQLSRNLGVEINSMEVGELFELLFEEPLSTLSDPGFTSLVVIDALDESEYQGRNELLDVVGKYFNKLPLWVRFLVTTRPEISIRESLHDLQPLQLEPHCEENLKDIRLYFQQRLSDVLEAESCEMILNCLMQKSEGVFLGAQFLVDSIKINFSTLTLEQLDSTLPTGISFVYKSYFKRLEAELCKELKITEDHFFSFLSAITAAREPLPLGFVSKLLFSGKWSSALQRKVHKAIGCISSLLPVQDDRIHFFHKSVKDWLTDKLCYGQHSFSVEEDEGHCILSRLCIEEYDDIKRRGVDSSQQISDTAKYALQHGVQHMLQLDEGASSYNLEELAKKFVIDVELVCAKLYVNSSTAIEDMLSLKKQRGLETLSFPVQTSFETLLTLLRKHRTSLNELPLSVFQTVLNEGGHELSSEASTLLETKYSDIPYMEYLDKEDLRGAVETEFYCSSSVACFDVSPKSDYMVCECHDGTIQLWSLLTGKLIWKRNVIKTKHYHTFCYSFRMLKLKPDLYSAWALSYFRSVVFHPSEDVVLPGVLSHAYSFNGELNSIFPESNCSFSVCSISGDRILTDCPGNARCLVMWSLKDGRELTRVTTNEDVLTFAWSRDGRLLAISHSSGSICVVDVLNGRRTLGKTTTPEICGMIKFSPDHQFLFCWHLAFRMGDERPVRSISFGRSKFFRLHLTVGDHENFSIDVSLHSCDFKPWDFESRSERGFMLGDPFCCPSLDIFLPFVRLDYPSSAFVLNQQSVLRSCPNRHLVTMLSLHKLRNNRDTLVSPDGSRVISVVFSLNGETLYVIQHGRNCPAITIISWDVSSGMLQQMTSYPGLFSYFFLVPVREGLLMGRSQEGWGESNWYTLELCNLELSGCIRQWNDITDITKLIPISDKEVYVECQGSDQAIILDTTTDDKRTRISPFPGQFVALSSTYQLITVHDDRLRSIENAIWERCWPQLDSNVRNDSVAGIFSPAETFFVISGVLRGHPQGIYVLDSPSGNTLHMLCGAKYVDGCKFVSNEECVILARDPLASGLCLKLFNVRSGTLLNVMDFGMDYRWKYFLASCPRRGLIAINHCSNQQFKVIQVKLPRKRKDSRVSERDGKHQQ